MLKEKKNVYKIIRITALLLIMILSIKVVTPIMSEPETYRKTVAELNEKQKTVMAVAAAATVSSIGLAVIPDDSTTPVANKIMDLAGYLVLILCVIVLEKYLLTIVGYAAFHWLIPAACVLLGINTFAKNKTISRMVSKILILCLAMMLVVPLSVRLSDMIEETHQVSIASTIETDSVMEELEEEDAAVEAEAEQMSQEKEQDASESGGWLKNALSNLSDTWDTVVETTQNLAENAASTVGNLTDGVVTKAQDMLNDFVETVVVLLVLNCILPVLVLLFLFWVINLIMGIQINLPDPRKITKHFHHKTRGDHTHE
ncbi:MAG: hypothetical protein Q4B85_12390 [Lachnospiraceae bacterium]|nr:hypothetical protein [Lachnospiraceae bacterium]